MPAPVMSAALSRREFLKAGAAVTVGIALAPELLAQAGNAPVLPASPTSNGMLSSWLRVDANGTVTVFTGRIELGAGVAAATGRRLRDVPLTPDRMKTVNA
jgi:nicotinate dehydrogenase subunit B